MQSLKSRFKEKGFRGRKGISVKGCECNHNALDICMKLPKKYREKKDPKYQNRSEEKEVPST